jgi:hypothetical protein
MAKTAPKKRSNSRKKLVKIDGLGPYEKKKIREAVRQVWHRSFARSLAVKRSTDAAGFSVCEKCRKRNPKNKIDHITQVGEVGAGFIERMFVPSSKLQALCKKCHDEKTREERRRAAAKKKAADADKDFY